MATFRTPLCSALATPASPPPRDGLPLNASPTYFGPTFLDFDASMDDFRLGPAFPQHTTRAQSDSAEAAWPQSSDPALHESAHARPRSGSPEPVLGRVAASYSTYFASELGVTNIHREASESSSSQGDHDSAVPDLHDCASASPKDASTHPIPTNNNQNAADSYATGKVPLEVVLGPAKGATLHFCDIREEGECSDREMTRIDILNEARSGMIELPHPKRLSRWLISAEEPNPDFEAFKQNVGWVGQRSDAPKHFDIDDREVILRGLLKSALKLRDIRQVDTRFQPKSSIWVRNSAIVVAIDNIRALICYDRVFLFDPSSLEAQRCRKIVRKHLAIGRTTEYWSDDDEAPFELLALEGILIAVVMGLENDYLALEPHLMSRMRQISLYLSSSHLEALRIQQQKLNHFRARADKVHDALRELLEDDEDMSRMYLTERREAGFIFRNPLDHDEVEALLEAYLQAVDELTTKARLLDESIDDLVDLIGLHLDTLRNKLLMVQLRLSIAGLMFTMGSMVAGIFGMNMAVPIFNSRSSGWWFLLVFSCVIIGVIGGSLGANVFLNKRGIETSI